MHNLIASCVLWATSILVPIGIVVLLVKRRYRTAFGFLGAVVAIITFYYFVLQVRDQHLRLWLIMPAALLVGCLGLFGIWICAAAWSALHGNRPEPIEDDILHNLRGPWLTRRRVSGIAIIASAVGAWLFGAASPGLGDWQFIPMIYSFYGFALGVYLFVHAPRRNSAHESVTPSN